MFGKEVLEGNRLVGIILSKMVAEVTPVNPEPTQVMPGRKGMTSFLILRLSAWEIPTLMDIPGNPRIPGLYV
jgi:hypothetical protein